MSTCHLTNCMRLFGEDVKYLIYCALLDVQLNIDCSNEQLKLDVQRFMQCCSLSELLDTLKGSDAKQSDSSCSDTGAVLVNISSQSAASDANAATLSVNNGRYTFSNCASTGFCQEWTSVLLSGDSHNAVYIKQVIENFKLRAIQDMNNLKRMLKQAENDYYALFRCCNFVQCSGNATVLLRHAGNEASNAGHSESLRTIQVLQDFMQTNKTVQ